MAKTGAERHNLPETSDIANLVVTGIELGGGNPNTLELLSEHLQAVNNFLPCPAITVLM
tara:strand:- start:362 stop:538 length:177 start_codon:yes stop_codon:yes gene_type:complete